MDTLKMKVSGILLTITTIGQIIAAFFFYDPEGSEFLINSGWVVILLSALFGWLPIFTFRRKGHVEGRAYIHTTKLVDSGVYGIVRHPQYLAGILISVALPMISWHWLVSMLGLFSIILLYWATFDEENRCIEKFGEDYQRYKSRVPRLNFIQGLWRTMKRKTSRLE